jgi:hypothetical protein
VELRHIMCSLMIGCTLWSFFDIGKRCSTTMRQYIR